MIDELKKLRDERSSITTIGYTGVGVPLRTPEQIAMLDALIKLFEGDSAEADVLGRLVEAWRGSSNPYLHEKSIAAATSGVLALRALPQVMAENETLRAELAALKRGRIAVENLIGQQVQIPPEFAQVLNDNFWDLA